MMNDQTTCCENLDKDTEYERNKDRMYFCSILFGLREEIYL